MPITGTPNNDLLDGTNGADEILGLAGNDTINALDGDDTIYGGLGNDTLRNADNNYWNGSVVAAFVVDKQTDAQVQATYYRTNNYNAALIATDPYGASGRDYTLTVGLKHKFTDKMVGSAKVGYLESKNETLGGNADFRGPVGYLALEHQF